MKLYELTEQYEELYSMLYDEEIDEQMIFDTAEGLEGEIEEKADNYAKMIFSMKTDIEAIKNEEKRLYAKRTTLENRSQSLKDMLQANLEFIGKTKFKTALFSFNVQKNGGLQPLTITQNLDEIPGKYLIPQPPKVNTDAVRKLLEGKEVEWAHLEPRGQSLRIR